LKPSTRGGLTGFIDQLNAYERLPEELKERVEDLWIVCQLLRHGERPYGTRSKVRPVTKSEASKSLFARRDQDFPPVTHPLVFVHAETGKKILNYSPHHSLCVAGLPEDESHALMMTLSNHIFDCPSYHHTWSTNELLLWDNWRMVHMVSLVPLGEERVMQRTTIVGDYGLGRKAERADMMAVQ
jgi:taurine dioxygenase